MRPDPTGPLQCRKRSGPNRALPQNERSQQHRRASPTAKAWLISTGLLHRFPFGHSTLRPVTGGLMCHKVVSLDSPQPSQRLTQIKPGAFRFSVAPGKIQRSKGCHYRLQSLRPASGICEAPGRGAPLGQDPRTQHAWAGGCQPARRKTDRHCSRSNALFCRDSRRRISGRRI